MKRKIEIEFELTEDQERAIAWFESAKNSYIILGNDEIEPKKMEWILTLDKEKLILKLRKKGRNSNQSPA